MNSSATPTLLSPNSPDQTNSLLGNESPDIQDLNSSHLDHQHRIHSPRDNHDEIATHDNNPKSSVVKTEYKSNFTPFDQYVYNERTDSFVKQTNNRSTVSNNLLVEMKRPLSSSGSNQDLAAQSEMHVLSAASPALEAGSFEPVGTSEAGNNFNSTNEPWYKEVAKRNQKANEYRLKSELGHSSALMAEPELIRKSPLGNDPMIEAQIQDKQHQLQSGYKYSHHEYKRDNLIAHMANNNNFKLPKEDGVNPSSTRKVVINSTGSSRPLSRTTAASRARSQSSKRPNSSVPSKSETLTKSNQTTPTRTVPSRAAAQAIRINPKPPTSSTRPAGASTNGVNRSTTAATARSSTTTASSRVSSSKPLTTPRSTRVTSAATSTKPTDSKTHDLSVARGATRASASSPATQYPVRRALNTKPTPSRTTPTARPISSRNTVSTNKSPTKPISAAPATTAVKSIKTKALVNAGQKSSVDATASSKIGDIDPKLVGLRPGSDFIQTLGSGPTQDNVNMQTPDKDAVENEEYKNRGTDLIFSTTKAGNMLADEIAQAEKAAHETVLKEKLEGNAKIMESNIDSTNRSDLELTHETPTVESVPKQLVNGLEEGLVSAEDRYESSERDASLECKNQSNDQFTEQHDQSYEHEPYSIIPTTYANQNKVESPSNDESVYDRNRHDSKRDSVNLSDLSPRDERLDLLADQVNESEDHVGQAAQDTQRKPEFDIPSGEQTNESARTLAQSDDSSPNLLHSSSSKSDELSQKNFHTSEDVPNSQSTPSEDIIETTPKDAYEENVPNDDLASGEKNAFNESFSNDHEFRMADVDERSVESSKKLEEDTASEPHLINVQQLEKIDGNVNDFIESDTSEKDVEVETGMNLEFDNPGRQEAASNEIVLDADQTDEKILHEDSNEQLLEPSSPMNRPVDFHGHAQTDHDNHEAEYLSKDDSDSDDEVVNHTDELLMNVAGLETMESMQRQAMSQKSDLARKQSGSSTLLAGQPMSELVLSVNQLDEYVSQVSPNQASEVDSAKQVEKKNNDPDLSHDLSRGEQHIDQISDLNIPKSNIQDSEKTEETVVQPIVESNKDPTADLLNFGSITPTNDDRSTLDSDVRESNLDGEKCQNDVLESRTYDTFEVNRQSSVEDSHRSSPSKESLSDSGEDIAVDQPKHSESVTNLETDSNQATKSTTSAIEDEMDEDEQLKLSNHLTNSDDDVILEPRNRKDSLSGAFSPHRSTSPSRYNEGAGLGIMVQDDEELGAVELSDGSSAQIVTPTVAENRAEILASKSLMPEIPQASMLMHTQKLNQDNVFDDDDEGYDLNPLADPIDVAATMSPSSSVAEEMLRLSRQASLANATSDMDEFLLREDGAKHEEQDAGDSGNNLIGTQNLQKNLDHSFEQSRFSSSSTISSAAQNLDLRDEATAPTDVGSSDEHKNDSPVDPLNNNETRNVETRKQSIDINSDRINTVEQSVADQQVKMHPTELPATTDTNISEDQMKSVDVGRLSTN